MSYKNFLVFAALLLSGCGEPQPQVSVEPAVEVAETSSSASLQAKLELADRLDGSEDHTVGKCYVCALGMNGMPDLTVEIEGYKAHLCSASCREYFAANWQSIVAKTEIPVSNTPEPSLSSQSPLKPF